jgi:hypothetical protein
MKLDIFSHIFPKKFMALTRRASIYEGNACRLLQLPARHWRTAHLDRPICCQGPLRPARQVPIIAVCCGLRTMRKRVQTWVPGGFNNVSLVRECSVSTRTNLCLLKFAGSAVEHV